MKLFSLVATLSCASVMAVCSLAASAETSLNGQNESGMETTANELANSESYEYLKQQSHLSRNNPHQKDKSIGYSVFSFAKDKQITLHNIEQELPLEDVEWYIEKF